jgi:hypothetical protein
LTKQYDEYHKLTELINKKWALHLGFQMKMLRPPKNNKDGTKTIRLYCVKFNRGANKKDSFKNPETKEEEDSCKFGITFKQDSETKIWLLYQEFDQNNFVHNHRCTERPNNLELFANEHDIKQRCSSYKRKIRNLITLQNLIDEKNDLVVKQKEILNDKVKKEKKVKVKEELVKVKKEKPEKSKAPKENKQGVRSVRNVSSAMEVGLFVECLKELNQKYKGIIEIDEEVLENGKRKINKLFYSNELMKKNFGKYRDCIYVHRRMNETRFNKFMTLVGGVDNEGYNKIFSI